MKAAGECVAGLDRHALQNAGEQTRRKYFKRSNGASEPLIRPAGLRRSRRFVAEETFDTSAAIPRLGSGLDAGRQGPALARGQLGLLTEQTPDDPHALLLAK